MTDEEKQAAKIFARMGGNALKKKIGSKGFSEMRKKGLAKRYRQKVV